MTTAVLPELHPAHLEDLRKSGLSDETIAAAGLRSVRPQDLARMCGRPVPDGTSGLEFPYDASFSRVKLFPPLRTGDKREQKYAQPLHSPVRAYIPAGIRGVLPDPTCTLFIVEGEKKTLKLWQEGFPALGLGGIWSFRSKGMPEDALIPDLEGVAWDGRIVYLLPDSDAWDNDHVKLAAFRFARLLEAREATVLMVKLPTLPGMRKTGADDFLVAKGERGPAAFRGLLDKAITLGHPAFRSFREREKRDARKTDGCAPPPPDAEEGAIRSYVDGIRAADHTPAFLKKRSVAEVVTHHLRDRGRFLSSPEGAMYFRRDRRSVLELVPDGQGLGGLLERFGLNPTEGEFRYVVQHLQVEALERGEPCEIRRLAHYDASAGVLYLSQFDGRALRLDGQDLIRAENGEGGIYFKDDPQWMAWEPDLEAPAGGTRELLVDPLHFEGGHIAIEDARRIWALWIFSIFFAEWMRTKPLCLLVGPKGSGKTSAFRALLVALLGPQADVVALEGGQRGEEAFIAAVTASRLVAFDNADAKITWLEDSLARLSTGADIIRRQLYTTNTLIRYRPTVFVGLTARTPKFRREDVAERTLVLPMAELEQKMPERMLVERVLSRRAALWGELVRDLNAIVGKLKIQQPPLQTTFRIADFLHFGRHVASGEEDWRRTQRAFRRMEVQQADFALSEDPLFTALEAWVQRNPNRGFIDATTLNLELRALADAEGEEWPYTTGQRLGTRLRDVQGALAKFFEVRRQEEKGKKRVRWSFAAPPEGR